MVITDMCILCHCIKNQNCVLIVSESTCIVSILHITGGFIKSSLVSGLILQDWKLMNQKKYLPIFDCIVHP